MTLIFGATATYAWFSSQITNLEGDLSLGNLAATVHIYENYDDALGEDTYIDGITDVTSIDSTGTAATTYNIADKPWYSNEYTSIYLEVENTGSIDLKSLLKVSYDNSNLLTYLSYYYYQLIDITDDVATYTSAPTDREKVSAYNSDFQDTIAANVATYISNTITNGYCITSSIPVMNMGTTEDSAKSYYRLDVALSEIPTELLTEFNALPVDQREIKVNGLVTLKQTNAPNDENDDSGVSVYVSTADAFINAINSAANGDTIYLTTSLAISRNITITHRVNIILNGHTLTINGNLAYDLGNSGTMTLDVSNSSSLYVLGSLIVDVPNATFKILGSGSSAQSIILGDGVTSGVGNFYVNCLKDDTNTETYGYYQYGVSVMKKISEVLNELATIDIDSNTRFSVGLGSTAGPLESSQDASNIEIYNSGEIATIDFSNMYQLSNSNVQIYIYNSNRFITGGTVITLPTWSLGWKSKELGGITNAINTRVINAPGSVTGYSVTGSSVFLDIDIQNLDVATDSVVDLGDNEYRVNIELDGSEADTLTVRYYLEVYYYNLHNGATQPEFEAWLTTMEGIYLYTYEGTVIKTLDFTFFKTYLTVLEVIDLTYTAIEADEIPASAFYNRDTLQNIYLPASELSIGASAFYGTSLSSITISNTITSIGANAFDINTTLNGLLKIFYESENTSSLLGYISSLTPAKTLLFMSPNNVASFKSNYSITDTWYMNSYATFDFIDEYLNHYRIIDGSSVEIVYYGGDWSTMTIPNTVINDLKTYRIVGVSNSAYRRSIGAAGTTAISLVMPDNVVTIKSDAFYASYIDDLDLNYVETIGVYAFSNTTIDTSTARPPTFLSMSSVGDSAFAGATIGTTGTTSLGTFETFNVTDGVINNDLNLNGSYTLGAGVFDSASFYGVNINLEGVDIILSTMTNNLSLYGCELHLDNVTEIGDSAFELKFKSYDELYPYNKVYAQEVKTIGRLAFKGMYLDEFAIGVKSLYVSQSGVNSNCSYGGTTSGMIYSDFKTTTLTIDGMLPEIASGRATFLFGSETAGRDYDNVYIKNTNGLLYDYLFYGSSGTNEITIDDLYLYDIDTIGGYTFYYANITTVHNYSGETPIDDSAVSSIGQYAFRYSTVDSLGDLTLTSVGTYAFANSTVSADSLTITGTVDEYAFSTADTTGVQTISITGTIEDYVFNGANIYTVTSIYINGTVGDYLFAGARIYDCTTLTFEDTTIGANSFSGTIISSACYIDTLGTCYAETLSFYDLTATTSTVDLTNCLTISHSALKQVDVLTVRLGNTSFLGTHPNTFIYGTVTGGIFTPDNPSTVTNLYIDGELPTEILGTYVLGAEGADVNITNIYITEYCTNIPDNMFYSESATNRLSVSNLYLESDALTIGANAFRFLLVDSIIYNAVSYGTISFTGQYAFYFAEIGNFVNFTYYDDIELEDTGVIEDITDYTFQYATFSQDSDLEVFNYAKTIGNHAFDHATFTETSGAESVSFDFTKVETIGYNVFDSIYLPLGTITLGNTEYYQALLETYYYGNPTGDEGIFTSNGSITIEEIIIAGDMPDANVTGIYQTRALGISGNSNLTITTATVNAAVTKLPAYVFSGYDVSYRTQITTLDIHSSILEIGEFAFAYNNINNINIYSSDIELNTSSFQFSILNNMVYDRTSGAGEITFDASAEYTFANSLIYSMTGFTDVSSGVFTEVNSYAFHNTTFMTDCDVSWIDYVEAVGTRAFMYTTFSQTSGSAYVDIDLSNAISLGEEIFAFIPVKIGSLTLGNSTYEGIYGTSYSYGLGTNGALYGVGEIDILNIVGNLPNTNSYNSLGNSYTDSTTWAVQYGTVNIASAVTILPQSSFISTSDTVPVIIGILNINSTTIDIKDSVFENATITTVNFTNTDLTVQADSFNNTIITTVDINALNIEFGNSTFADATITTLAYTGTNSGTISMNGQSTFAGASLGVITGFTYVDVTEQGIISDISNYGFSQTIFGEDCDLSFIEHVDSIGDYGFSEATFTKTSLDNFIDLDLTGIVTIGSNAFYHLPVALGTITVGNDSYTSNPSYAYGNGTLGIFNNTGTIQHLIIDGELPTTAYSLGNRTSNITFLTTYGVVEIDSSINTLPTGVFAGADTVYATTIDSLYINSSSIIIGSNAFYNTIITNLYIPNTTTFNGVGANAFRDSNVTTADVTNTLTITGSINDYAFYNFDFTGITLDVTAVSYVGEYAFSYITYTSSLLFSSVITLIDADYMFANANISGNLTFNSISSLGSNAFDGIISGTGVTYSFTFVNCSSVTADYAFGNMNGGGSVYVSINGLPTLNSYRAFYNSTNIITIVFDEDLINLNEDNIFESASNLVSIAFNNEIYVTVVNSTITTLPSATKIYVPGTMLSEYLLDSYWSLVSSQISTTYNIDTSSTWGFYIIGITTDASLCKYLSSSTSVTVPETISYKSTTYTVLALTADIFTGTAVTDVTIPRAVESVDMDLFSSSNITDVSFTGTGTEPFYIDTDVNSNKLIYDSSAMTVLYKYLPSNTSTSYTIETSVIEIAEKAFYQNDYIENITFIAGTIQTGNSNGYVTTYPSNLTLAQYAITECDALLDVHLQNNSSGFGVILSSYSIALNDALTDITITGFSSIINSYAIYDNDALELVDVYYATDKAFGSNSSGIYANISIEPYAFFGSGSDTVTSCFYTETFINYIHSHSFANSRITLFEFNVDISDSEFTVDVYNPDAFAVGLTIEVNAGGDVIQTYEDITIRVPTALLATYQALPGFSFYSDSIVGVASFSHTLP
jgi:hypothetical protein